MFSDYEKEEPESNEAQNISIEDNSKRLTRRLMHHRGQLLNREREALLELIQEAAKVMRFY